MGSSVRVGLLGCGVVGSGVVRIFRENQESLCTRAGVGIRLVCVGEPDRAKAAAAGVPTELLAEDSHAMVIGADVDIVIECIGGVGIARELVSAALHAGKSVVTPNKELIAKHGNELLRIADETRVDLRFEASVGAGIPLIRSLKEHFAADSISSVAGIVNGTTNCILTMMAESGTPFPEALAQAQARGYAEPDPTDDISGSDAAYKLSILASIAFAQSVPVQHILKEGVERIHPRDIEAAGELGYAIKLLAIGKKRDDGRIEVRVHPTMIPKSHPLAAVSGVANAVFVTSEYTGSVMLYGPGAGSMPTANAILGDVVEIARNHRCGATGRVPHVCTQDAEVLPKGDAVCGHYMRVLATDKPGVLGAIATVLGDHGVSVGSVYQHHVEGSAAEIVWIMHPGPEHEFQAAVAAIEPLDVVETICNTIRVEAHL